MIKSTISGFGECGDCGVAFPQKSDNVINTKVASGEHEGKVSPDDQKNGNGWENI